MNSHVSPVRLWRPENKDMSTPLPPFAHIADLGMAHSSGEFAHRLWYTCGQASAGAAIALNSRVVSPNIFHSSSYDDCSFLLNVIVFVSF